MRVEPLWNDEVYQITSISNE